MQKSHQRSWGWRGLIWCSPCARVATFSTLGLACLQAFAFAIQAGVQIKRQGHRNRFALSITDSLEELRRLANTAGLQVIGQTFQALEAPHPVRPAPLLACPAVSCRARPDTERVAPQRSYLGAGKLAELVRELAELRPDTVIFDDELTPGQLRNLEKACPPALAAGMH